MATKYKTCTICGHQYPTGHPCLTCNKKGLEGVQITPEDIGSFVNILSLRMDDIIVLKCSIDRHGPEELGDYHQYLESLPIIQKKRIKILIIDADDEIVVLRK